MLLTDGTLGVSKRKNEDALYIGAWLLYNFGMFRISSPPLPNYTFWFYLLLVLHIILWTLVSALLRHTLPMDALEGFVWGQDWSFGYDRNPWLNAWLTHIAVALSGRSGESGWLVYLFSQLSVALCFLSVWHLGRKFLSPLHALIAVFILVGVQYYTIAAVDFNDNVLEIGLWAALALFFYNALMQQKWRDWLLTGMCAALSLMAKYYALALFLPMFLLLLFTAKGRASFKCSGIYLGGALFLLIVAPHFVWLLQHGFVTLSYTMMRATDVSNAQNSVWYFAMAQLLSLVAPLFLLALALFGRRKESEDLLTSNLNKSAGIFIADNFTKIFLLALGLGPFIATLVLAVLCNISVHVMWGAPLLSLWGLLLMVFMPPVWLQQITRAKFYRFVGGVFIVFFGVLIVYSYNLVYTGYISSATYPGKTITAHIMSVWRAQYYNNAAEVSPSPSPSPRYVVGDRYTAGNVAYFARYLDAVQHGGNQQKVKACIWEEQIYSRASGGQIYSCDSDAQLLQQGAVFVWRSNGAGAVSTNVSTLRADAAATEATETLNFIARIKQRFPTAVFFPPQGFKWIYHPTSPSLYIGYAFLPPIAAVVNAK